MSICEYIETFNFFLILFGLLQKSGTIFKTYFKAVDMKFFVEWFFLLGLTFCSLSLEASNPGDSIDQNNFHLTDINLLGVWNVSWDDTCEGEKRIQIRIGYNSCIWNKQIACKIEGDAKEFVLTWSGWPDWFLIGSVDGDVMEGTAYKFQTKKACILGDLVEKSTLSLE